MAKRTLRPPGDTQRSSDRERASFERNVTEKLDNTDYTIDDLSRVIFFTNRTTQGQQTELDLEQYTRIIFNKLNARDMELQRLCEENLRLAAKIYGLNAKIEETHRQLEELRRLAWQ